MGGGRRRRSEEALHWLVADDDEADVRIDLAGQRPDLRPGVRSLSCGRRREQSRQGDRSDEKVIALEHDYPRLSYRRNGALTLKANESNDYCADFQNPQVIIIL